LQNVTAPTLILAGDRDRAIPPENSKFLAKGIPGAKLEEIKDAAHAFCYSHPDTTADLAINFLL
jgi:pimeloyl-ACP methyl ester carboxylesterase